ncbi:uncharacterized protein EV420DRAFT_647952 [Desarmillaria tabescens]|uniref:Uncharacterized protein n=1 Tax=Armillaria tabescens TaxID=1929756 RepID=A0AA39NJJ2_ARMTA|nr:uncharacterized protein EV420DRAFT_647952 [Desarmillaria tabescens]KAK0466775.1 hypothetical protein EV420DRAFT_647952 [Desarmillaria tabescens]
MFESRSSVLCYLHLCLPVLPCCPDPDSLELRKKGTDIFGPNNVPNAGRLQASAERPNRRLSSLKDVPPILFLVNVKARCSAACIKYPEPLVMQAFPFTTYWRRSFPCCTRVIKCIVVTGGIWYAIHIVTLGYLFTSAENLYLGCSGSTYTQVANIGIQISQSEGSST